MFSLIDNIGSLLQKYNNNINIIMLKDKDFDLMKTIYKQKMKGNFDMLHGPIYTNLVIEFWLNVFVRQSG